MRLKLAGLPPAAQARSVRRRDEDLWPSV